MRNQKGITLIALTITIIVLLILVSITTYTGLGVVESGKLTRFRQELEIMQAEVDLLYEKYKDDETIVLGKDLSTADNDKSLNAFKAAGIEEERYNYRYFDKETIENLGIVGIENEYLINMETRDVLCLDGLDINGTIYYSLNQITGKMKGGEINRGEVTFNVTCKTSIREKKSTDRNASAARVTIGRLPETEELPPTTEKPITEEMTDEIILTNIKFSKYVGKAVIQYKDMGKSENWITLEQNAKEKDYTFKIKGYGSYIVRITDAANVFAEKTIKRITFNEDYEITDIEERKRDDGLVERIVKKYNIIISNIKFSSDDVHKGIIQYKKYNNESVITEDNWITLENNAIEGRDYVFEMEGEQTYLIRIKDELGGYKVEILAGFSLEIVH